MAVVQKLLLRQGARQVTPWAHVVSPECLGVLQPDGSLKYKSSLVHGIARYLS